MTKGGTYQDFVLARTVYILKKLWLTLVKVHVACDVAVTMCAGNLKKIKTMKTIHQQQKSLEKKSNSKEKLGH